MQNKHYVIPDNCRSYSREPRAYRPRPPAPRAAPSKPAAKIYFSKSTLPQVSKLKPLEKYQPRALEKPHVTVSRMPSREPVRSRPGTPRAGMPVPGDGAPRANITARQQTQYDAELRRRQAEHMRQQQQVQAEHQRRLDQERERHADQARRENQRRDKARAAENRTAAPGRNRDRRAAEEDDHELEAPAPQSRHTHADPPSREELKREIRRKLAAGQGKPGDTDAEAEMTVEGSTPPTAKSSGCAGNIIVILVLGTILYFTFCSGMIDELLK